MSDLPTGWTVATVPEIAEVLDSRRIPLNASERATRKGTFAYYGANGQVDSINAYLFEGPHVLVAEDGGYFDQPERGVAYLVDGKFWVNNHAHILRPRDGIDPRYLLHVVNSTNWMPHVGGTTRLKLTQAALCEPRLPVASAAEQRRIVAKLDALSARSKRARAELDRVEALAERARQAVLALAFTGKLTVDCRDPGEPYVNGLPESWSLEALGDISEIQGGIQVGKKRDGSAKLVEVPYLRVANVQRGWLKLDEIKTIWVSEEEKRRLILRRGDVLMNEGGDRDKLGRGWVWGGQIEECIHQNHVFRIRLHGDTVPPEFLSLYANEHGQQYFIDEGKQTTNLASISKSKVASLPVPVPPSAEATEIVRRVSELFVMLERVGGEHTSALRLLSRLDQSILSRAFRGELVPQDPSDEPAGVLLDRIRAEREAGGAAPKRRRPAG